jgi:hypothetical protein
VMLALGTGVCAFAQNADAPLGDVARSYRKTQAPPRAVIDNDNLSDVMEEGESKKWEIAGLRFTLDPITIKTVNASSPDVTCALSFSAANGNGAGDGPRAESLPDSELSKLDGPATIVGDELQVSIYNGSAWSLREITVGLTLVRRGNPAAVPDPSLKLLPATMNSTVVEEKRSDMTVLYHLQGSAAPFATTILKESLSTLPAPDQEWHWAIVRAKGIPPAPDAQQVNQASTN